MVTSTSQEALTEGVALETAVMVALPLLRPLTTPFSSTAATVGSEEVQLTDLSARFQGLSAALSLAVLPASMLMLPVERVRPVAFSAPGRAGWLSSALV